MALSTASLIALLDSAIEALLTGAEEYSIGSRRVKRTDLATLMQERRVLLNEQNRSEGGGGMFRLGAIARVR